MNEVEQTLAYEKLRERLPRLFEEAAYIEVFGINLRTAPEPTKEIVLRKFLAANEYDVELAASQLLKTLKWRREFNPLSAAFLEKHSSRFDPVGKVTKDPATGTVITWNLYGAVADRAALFGDTDAFLRWRVGLMERGIAELPFTDAESSVIAQVHDYAGVNMWAMDSATRASTKATVALFQDHYPEMLSKKLFVNVPTVMGWVFTLVKPLLSKATLAKFTMMSSGKGVAAVLGTWVPASYGGTGDDLAAQAVVDFKARDEGLLMLRENHHINLTDDISPGTTVL